MGSDHLLKIQVLVFQPLCAISSFISSNFNTHSSTFKSNVTPEECKDAYITTDRKFSLFHFLGTIEGITVVMFLV